MPSFAPLSELECLNVLPDGKYEFVVEKAENRQSKNGNPMIAITLGVYDDTGAKHTIFDYLVFTKGMMYKVRHFAYAIGIGDKYEAGTIEPEMCLNRSGECMIGTDQPEIGSKYLPKNVVLDYVKKDGLISLDATKKDEFINDAIPF